MARPHRLSPLVVLTALAAACADGTLGPPSATELVERFDLRPMPAMVFPADNLPDPERIELGKLLFFDPIQSADGDVACSTCHLPRFGFADGRDLPAGPSGVGLGPDRVLTRPDMVLEGRHSPTVINVGFNRFGAQVTADGFMFWDGRKRRLENLVTLPQTEFSEMRGDAYPPEHTTDTVLARLRRIPEYEERFRRAFPRNAAGVDRGDRTSAVDSLAWAQSLAQFLRSLTSTDSRYDRFVSGDEEALTRKERWGLYLFHTKARCATCHSGPMFSDFDFHALGAKQLGPGFQGTPHEDFGRWNVTRLESDRYKFRTPSLRNVGDTAPYMHSGGYPTLWDVLRFKNRGGGDHPAVGRELIELEPLGLTEREIDAIVAFLLTLSDLPRIEVPDRVPSGLEVPR